MQLISKLPYRRYIIASLLRGRDAARIETCLINIGLCTDLSVKAINEALEDLNFKNDIKEFSKASLEDKLAIANKYDADLFLRHFFNQSKTWQDCWDILSISKYREFVLVLASMPSVDSSYITNELNKKFNRNFSRDSVNLLILTFWDCSGLTTVAIKHAIDKIRSKALSRNLHNLLFGDPIRAVKAVGANIHLNYCLILEEMLMDAYLKYKDSLNKKMSTEEWKSRAEMILKIGDRADKLSKKNIDADVLHNLLRDLKLETESTDYTLDDFDDNEDKLDLS